MKPPPGARSRRTFALRRRSPTSDIDARRPAHGEDLDATMEAARYIADMTAQLASMARAANLDMVAFLLEMARVEAETASRDASGDEAAKRFDAP